MSINFAELRPWAKTEAQQRTLEAVLEAGSYRAATRLLGQSGHSTVQRAMSRIIKEATLHGWKPSGSHITEESRTVLDPYVVKGHSILDRVGPNGERRTILEWTKTRIDDEQYIERLQSGIETFLEGSDLSVTPALPPKSRDQDIIPWIQIGDAHLGMLAHEAETGANFDLKIAQRELLAAIFMLIDESEPTERIVINDLGDFTHYENMAGKTEASGHDLDYDGRFPKMIDVYSYVMRAIVDKALTKANHVDIIVNQGNHSRTNDIWMAVLLRAVYGHTGRVHVLNNRSPFIGYRMGNTFVMTHHSDTAKPNRLASVMSTDFAKDWGETDYRYIDIGHIHHNMVLKEHPGVVIESWNILAPKDKWANDGGYRSRQSISIVERSRTYGEQRRRILPIRQVQDNIEAMFLKEGKPAPYRPQPIQAFTV
jgi:hypothetical protein